MEIEFFKYQGAGNDFIIIDNRNNNICLSEKQIAFLCDRRFGIGADGLMLLNKSDKYDFEMFYANSDGKESTMCGNGGRCIVAFAKKLQLINTHTTFLAVDGVHDAVVIDNNIISLQMIDVNDIQCNGADFVLNTGSPHYIKFVDNISSIDVNNYGKQIRYSNSFAEDGINVNFIQEENDYIVVRTYERGVEAETLACGTGATAAVLAYLYKNNIKGSKSVKVKVLGGELIVSCKSNNYNFSEIYLEGPANFVYKGCVNV